MNQLVGISLWLLGARGLAVLGILVLSTWWLRAALRSAQRPRLLTVATGLQQGCAIPFRIEDNQVQVCLISLSNQSGWGFPKVMVDPPESVAAAALRESFEEAGVCGLIVGEALGEYSYIKRDAELHVTVFLMRVTAVERHWPERRVRQRQFCPLSQARALVATSAQRELLEVAMARLAELPKVGTAAPLGR